MKTHCAIFKICFVIFTCCQNTVGLAQTDSTRLSLSTGKFRVGSKTFEMTDTDRQNRIIPYQIWYPAQIAQVDSTYPYANSTDYAHVRIPFSPNARFNRKAQNCPLILICPGRGVEKFAYTTLAAELASHGYVVVSVDMPEIGYVIYKNGQIIKPNPAFRPSRDLMLGDYAKVDAFFETPAQLGKADIDFVLKKLKESVFREKINFKNIGLFGHSLGGRIAGAFAASHPDVKAFISMEGIPPRPVRYEGMAVPMALLYSSRQPDAAMVNYRSVIEGRKADVYLMELNGFGHNSLTDFVLITPSAFKYKIDPKYGLMLGRQLVLDYFNKYLKGKTVYFKKLDSVKTEFFSRKKV
jgi:pimeloyl-ACP methyl ester carboxylesterase